MRINRKFSLYFLATFIFALSAFAFVSVAKNIWKAKNAKAESVSESAKKEEVKESLATTPIAETQQVAATDSSGATATTDNSATDATVATGDSTDTTTDDSKCIVHKNISTTYFWAGEEADADNKNISNS